MPAATSKALGTAMRQVVSMAVIIKATWGGRFAGGVLVWSVIYRHTISPGAAAVEYDERLKVKGAGVEVKAD